jgi:hypothetical protein
VAQYQSIALADGDCNICVAGFCGARCAQYYKAMNCCWLPDSMRPNSGTADNRRAILVSRLVKYAAAIKAHAIRKINWLAEVVHTVPDKNPAAFG